MKKFRILGIVALVAAIMFSMAACGDDDSGGGGSNTSQKIIIITGVPDDTTRGGCLAYISSHYSGGSSMGIPVTGNSITFTLTDMVGGIGVPYTGNGPHVIELVLTRDGGYFYVYTDGKSLAELGLSWSPSDRMEYPKYNITSATTTIPFSKFSLVQTP